VVVERDAEHEADDPLGEEGSRNSATASMAPWLDLVEEFFGDAGELLLPAPHAAGVKAAETRRRMRVCCGLSLNSIREVKISRASGSSTTTCFSAARRGSRRRRPAARPGRRRGG